MSSSKPTMFYLRAACEIEAAQNFNSDDLYFTFFFNSGPDWELLKGADEGSSQTALRSNANSSCCCSFVWNFPIDVTFKSTNPFGWPQLIISVYGSDLFGNDVIKGYTVTHLPISPGRHLKKLKCFVPDSASTLQKVASWFTGRRPEFVDPNIIAGGSGREVTRVRSQGEILASVDIMIKDFDKLGYNHGTRADKVKEVSGMVIATTTQRGREDQEEGGVIRHGGESPKPSTSYDLS